MSHLFVCDPISKLNLKLDSSLTLALHLKIKGEEVFFATPTDLYLSSDSPYCQAKVSKMEFSAESIDSVKLLSPENHSLAEFRFVHMRKEPPFNTNYISTTWLLDKVPSSTVVINNPEALRKFNEKLCIFAFPDFIQAGLVSADPKELMKFIQSRANQDAILKPLELYGGKGVIRLNLSESSEEDLLQQLTRETQNGAETRLIQPFDEAVFQGEVRAFAAWGKPISWCLKKPAKGSYLANTGSGATLEDYQPNQRETEIVERVSRKLLKHGVFLTGFDLIGGFLSEVNITSPRLLAANPVASNKSYSDLSDIILKNSND